MDVFNLFNGETETPADPNDPPGYASSGVRVAPKIGASKLGMSVYELPGGQAICPYHFEWTDEEWLIVIAGRPTLRSPEGEQPLEPGDMVCFPIGPDGAHFVRNDGEELVASRDPLDEERRGHRRVPGQRQGRRLGQRDPLHAAAGDHLDYWEGSARRVRRNSRRSRTGPADSPVPCAG